MEKQYTHTINGQAVNQGNLNILGESSGLADDRVFAELLRMKPYNGSAVSKGILRHGHQTSAAAPLISPNGATGGVLVNPFRALVGPRTAVATDAKKNWRDIRSAIAVGTTTLGQAVTFGANASGNPRWDLVYAIVDVNAVGDSVSIKKKDVTTGVVASASVVTTRTATVALAVQAGTAAASPVWPSIPADSGTTYMIPLAYVRVGNGFTSGSTVLDKHIALVAPCLALSETTGAPSIEVANQHYTGGGAVISTAKIQAWGASGSRPDIWMPPTWTGGRSLILSLDLTTGSESVATGGVVDDRDWRGRFCKYTGLTGYTTDRFAWDNYTVSATTFPGASFNADQFMHHVSSGKRCGILGIGQTMPSLVTGIVAHLDGSELMNMTNGSTIEIQCDYADSGKLKAVYSGAPNCKVILWIEFSGVFENL